MYHRNLNEVWKPILPIAVVAASILWFIVETIKLATSVVFDQNVLSGIGLAVAKAASTIEIAIAVIGLALLVAAFIAYPGSKVDDDLRIQLNNLSSRFEEWRERYVWFDAYVGYAKDWAESMMRFDQIKSAIDQNNWNDLVHRAIVYHDKLESAVQRMKPLEAFFDGSIELIRTEVENDYMSKARFSIILAAIGLGLIVLALILPSSDTLLGVIASGLVDPSLVGQERLNAISEMKNLLKSL